MYLTAHEDAIERGLVEQLNASLGETAVLDPDAFTIEELPSLPLALMQQEYTSR